ncbi:MAG: hypothetical protein QOH96_1173 [Blastocatellia bacterium]|nr:hypothetical protein [Blastocatellia bacterium]
MRCFRPSIYADARCICPVVSRGTAKLVQSYPSPSPAITSCGTAFFFREAPYPYINELPSKRTCEILPGKAQGRTPRRVRCSELRDTSTSPVIRLVLIHALAPKTLTGAKKYKPIRIQIKTLLGISFRHSQIFLTLKRIPVL